MVEVLGVSEMVERIARKIFKIARSGVDPMGDAWKDYEPDARAAIEAMRKLTPEMLQAGQGWDGIPAIWNRMIDAALK